MTKPLVLVTGSAGRIGQAVVRELAQRKHPVRGFDLVPTPGISDFVVGSLSDPVAIDRAMKGAGTLIHLAATPDDADFLSELAPNNIVGVYHVFDSALRAGVQRMVLASSGQMNWYQRVTGPFPIKADGPIGPRYWYAATKAFLEAAGKGYSETHGMSVLAIRLGWCPRSVEQVKELDSIDWAPDVYLSPGDAGRFFACAVEAPAIPYAILYATSKPAKLERYDLTPAKKLLGYEPRDVWPQGVEDMRGR